MTRTGKFATAAEIAAIKETANTPLIALQCGMSETPLQHAHRVAIGHGLPEITGYYGIDLKTGEFIAP